jgi:1-deoxy-D-xylulose-5-phosphate reductoisomerase
MGFPDMKLPIQLALTWPDRMGGTVRPFDPFDRTARSLTFEEPDRETFPALNLAYEAARSGGTLPAVMNAANEVAVNRFLTGSIRFSEIASLIERCMDRHLSHGFMTVFGFDDMMEQDYWARAEAAQLS